MKHIILSCLFLVLAPGLAISADKKKKEKKPVVLPVAEYWDANAWESGSSAAFWRASAPAPKQVTGKKQDAARKLTKRK